MIWFRPNGNLPCFGKCASSFGKMPNKTAINHVTSSLHLLWEKVQAINEIQTARLILHEKLWLINENPIG